MKLWDHPLFQCGFRPFFVLVAVSACVFLPLWLLVYLGAASGLAGMEPPGGWLLWHAHELIYGFGMAAVAGFLLTAVPEFTASPAVARRHVFALALLWVAARLAYPAAGWLPAGAGIALAALCNLALFAALLRQLIPPVWRDPDRKHVSFAWFSGALMLLQAAFFLSLWLGLDAMAWLRASVGIMMVLIVLAGSRVSMSVVNRQVEAARPGAPELDEEVGYLARPPRRYLAIFMISLCSLVELVHGQDSVTGWVALAASASMLNLLNDWHIGKPLFTRWALMLYASYWLVALGYAAMGLSWLGLAGVLPSAGRHLLMAGAMAVSIFTIMNIAGRIHAGRWLDYRPWVPVAASLLVLAALVRLLAGAHGLLHLMPQLLWLSGGLWTGAFLIYLLHAWPVLARSRPDGLEGCQEPVVEGEEPRKGC